MSAPKAATAEANTFLPGLAVIYGPPKPNRDDGRDKYQVFVPARMEVRKNHDGTTTELTVYHSHCGMCGRFVIEKMPTPWTHPPRKYCDSCQWVCEQDHVSSKTPATALHALRLAERLGVGPYMHHTGVPENAPVD